MLEQLFDNPKLLILAGSLTLAGIVLFFEGFKKLRTLRRIENTPTCNTRSMPMGSVEVKGVARMEEPLEAPFSGIAVAYYKVEIEEYRKSGSHSSWVTIHEDASETPFYLEDDTGEVLVNPQGVETHIAHGYLRETSRFSDAPVRLQNYMLKNYLERKIFNQGRRLRFSERHIGLGQRVYVHGVAQERRRLDLWREQMQRVSEKLSEVKADPDEMRRLDVDGDGRVSEDEWQMAHSRAVAEVRHEGIENRVAIAQGSSGELFLISDRSEKDLVGRLRWETAGGVLGGGAAFIAGVVILASALKHIKFFG